MKQPTFTLTTLGGGREIGANGHHLDLGGLGLLLDTGMHPRLDGAAALPDFDAVTGEVDAILISHAHLDHVGALPVALKRFTRSRLYMTGPTALLATRMLRNAVSINRLRAGDEPPLFSHEEVEWVEQITVTCEMDEQVELDGPGGQRVQLRFLNSGHLLGAAGVLVQCGGRRLFYTGDTCAAGQQICTAATYPRGDVDLLVLECTHGADEDDDPPPSFADAAEQLGRFIRRVADRGGSVLIPVFAMGRAQEILAALYRLALQQKIPPLPIHLSGLAHAVCRIYDATRRDSVRNHPDLRLGDLGYSILRPDVMDPETLLERPCVLVVTSGMVFPRTASHVLAQAMVPDPRHGVALVGYMDPESPGHALATADGALDLGHGPVKVAAEIRRFPFTAHSSAAELVQLVRRLTPRRVALVHGDDHAVEALARRLAPFPVSVTVAEPGGTMEW